MRGCNIALCDAFWRISDLFRFKAGSNVNITFYLYTLLWLLLAVLEIDLIPKL